MNPLNALKSAGPTILPSMLLCDFGNLAEEIQRLEEAGVAGLHLDIMDGVFVPNFTYGLTIVRAIRKLTDLPIDAHLMMVQPEKYVQQFRDAGADIISFHLEATDVPEQTLSLIKESGAAAGIAINPPTPASNLESIVELADMILVMSVNAGFGGQSFDATVLEKFSEIRQMRGGEAVALEIDGGINPETIRQATDAGAQLLVAGSAIFKKEDYRVAIETMMSQLDFAS